MSKPEKPVAPGGLHASEVDRLSAALSPHGPSACTGRMISVCDTEGQLLMAPFNITADGVAQVGAPLIHPRCQSLEPAAIVRATEGMFCLGAETALATAAPGAPLGRHLLHAGWQEGPLMLEFARRAPARLCKAHGEYIPFTDEKRSLFAETFYRTLEGSLDAPDMPVCRDPDRLMRSFEERGAFGQEDFAVLAVDGEPAGLVMAADVRGTLEILYLGVVPECRGRGHGGTLLERALERACARGQVEICAFVDERNSPAQGIYRRRGFREKRAVQVYIAAAENFPKRLSH